MDRKEFIKNYVNQNSLHYDKIQKRLMEINNQKDENGDYIIKQKVIGLVDHLQVDGPDLFPLVLYSEDEKHINYTEALITIMIEIENNSNTEFICIPHCEYGHEYSELFGVEAYRDFDYDGVTPIQINLYKAEKINEYLKWKHHQVGIYPPEIK